MERTIDTTCGGCGRVFPTLADVFSHDCPPGQLVAAAPVREVQVVRPQWRGMPNTTLGDKARAGRSRRAAPARPVPVPPPPPPRPAPAPVVDNDRAQYLAGRRAQLRRMLAERAGIPEAEQVRDRLNEFRALGGVSDELVALAITELAERVPYAGPNSEAHEDGGCRRCARTGLFITGTVNGVPTGPGGPCFRCGGKGRQSDCGTVAHAERQRRITRNEQDTTACCDRVRNDLYDRFGIRLSV